MLGEGGSGGALALGVANRVLMLEYAIYSVITPEGCASILWKDAAMAPAAAEALRLTAPNLLEQGLIDAVVDEPLGGAHSNWDKAAALLKAAVLHAFDGLAGLGPEELVRAALREVLPHGQFLLVTALPWRMRRPVPAGAAPWAGLEREWGLSSAGARLAWLREAGQAGELAWRLDPSWARATDPFLLEGVAAAVARIRRALAGREPICVYGDYDVDGVTATALLVRVLEKLGAEVALLHPEPLQRRLRPAPGLHPRGGGERAARP